MSSDELSAERIHKVNLLINGVIEELDLYVYWEPSVNELRTIDTRHHAYISELDEAGEVKILGRVKEKAKDYRTVTINGISYYSGPTYMPLYGASEKETSVYLDIPPSSPAVALSSGCKTIIGFTRN